MKTPESILKSLATTLTILNIYISILCSCFCFVCFSQFSTSGFSFFNAYYSLVRTVCSSPSIEPLYYTTNFKKCIDYKPNFYGTHYRVSVIKIPNILSYEAKFDKFFNKNQYQKLPLCSNV